MAPELKELLRSAAAEAPGPVDIDDVQRRARVVRRGRRVQAAASGVAAVVLVALAVTQFADVVRQPDVEFAEPSPKDPKDPGAPPDTWTELPVAPIAPRSHAAAVWTGQEMVVWGGLDPAREFAAVSDGAAFDPETHRWRRLPPAPVELVSAPSGVWTGEDVLVWGAADHGPVALAYSPERDAWRELAPPPVKGDREASTVWTGSEMVVWGGRGESGPATNAGAAYDPEREQWRVIAPAPLEGRFRHGAVWSGDEMIVWGGSSGDGARTRDHGDGAAYDPARDTWRLLPQSPLGPRAPTAVVWTGEEMVVLGGLVDGEESRDLARYRPARDRWEELPEIHHEGLTGYAWADDQIIALGTRGILAMGSNSGWSQMLPMPPVGLGSEAAVAWTGERLIIWGGIDTDGSGPAEGGAVLDTRAYPGPGEMLLRPPADPVPEPEVPQDPGAAWPPADIDGPWRNDPSDLAMEFGAQVLRWRDARVTDGEPSEDGRSGERLTLTSRRIGRSVDLLVLPDEAVPDSVRDYEGSYSVAEVVAAGRSQPRVRLSIRGDRATLVIAPGGGSLGDAVTATVHLQYGRRFGSDGELGGRTPWKIRLTLPYPRRDPGSLLILFEDADGNVIGARGIGLPPGNFAAG